MWSERPRARLVHVASYGRDCETSLGGDGCVGFVGVSGRDGDDCGRGEGRDSSIPQTVAGNRESWIGGDIHVGDGDGVGDGDRCVKAGGKAL